MLYTPIQEAKKEIIRRAQDESLKQKVVDYLGGDLPPVFQQEPRAVTTIHIGSPHLAFSHFMEGSRQLGLKPLVFEYRDDLFLTTNFDKASLAKMTFHGGRDQQGNIKKSSKQIINLDGQNEKKPFKDLTTLWGESFVNFHHRLLAQQFPQVETYDGSEWYHKKGPDPKKYYRYAMALYICHGVLFENFLLDRNEIEFTNDIIIPAFQEVRDYFELEPIIVPIAPLDVQEDRSWWYYPEFLKDKIIPN
jgi:hypothetical protein